MVEKDMTIETKVALFKGKRIRKIVHNDEWWFSIVDIVETLTDSVRPSVYWSAMKARVKNEDGIQLSTICRQLKLETSDGKMRLGLGLTGSFVFDILEVAKTTRSDPFRHGGF